MPRCEGARTRVHGDEDAERRAQGEAAALKVKDGQASSLGSLHRENLLRDHGEHLQVDAVELVEARPACMRCPSVSCFEGALLGSAGLLLRSPCRNTSAPPSVASWCMLLDVNMPCSYFRLSSRRSGVDRASCVSARRRCLRQPCSTAARHQWLESFGLKAASCRPAPSHVVRNTTMVAQVP